MSHNTIAHVLLSTFKSVLNFLFPPHPLDKVLETLTEEKLQSRVKHYEKDNMVALFAYSDELVKHMVWKLKYHGDTRVAELCVTSMCDYLTEELSDRVLFDNFTEPVLVPVPLGKRRLRERGFNQAALLARALESQVCISNALYAELLVKIRETAPQTSLSKVERATNLAGAFVVQIPKLVRNKNILLIDDVTTTGSTFREARKVLLDAGARSVFCLAVAH